MSMPALFSPLRLRGLFLRNRLVLSPMCQYAAVEGVVQDWHHQHHARFAAGGLALGFVEATRDFWFPGVSFVGGEGILFRLPRVGSRADGVQG